MIYFFTKFLNYFVSCFFPFIHSLFYYCTWYWIRFKCPFNTTCCDSFISLILVLVLMGLVDPVMWSLFTFMKHKKHLIINQQFTCDGKEVVIRWQIIFYLRQTLTTDHNVTVRKRYWETVQFPTACTDVTFEMRGNIYTWWSAYQNQKIRCWTWHCRRLYRHNYPAGGVFKGLCPLGAGWRSLCGYYIIQLVARNLQGVYLIGC